MLTKDAFPRSELNFISVFNKIFLIVFSLFIFMTLSFGRAFSIAHVGSLYVTEIILFLSFLFFLMNLKSAFKIPPTFLFCLGAYFALGSIHLTVNLLRLEINSLRGVVFFGYIFFLFSAYLMLPDENRMKKFLIIVILSNIIGLILTRFCIYRQYPLFPELIIWWGQIKAINFVLYYGITFAFMFPFLDYIKNKTVKLLIIILCALNCYMLAIWGVRTSWVALIVLIVFLILVLKNRFFNIVLGVALAIILSSAIFASTIDKDVFKEKAFLPKLTSLLAFTKHGTLKKQELPTINTVRPVNIPREEGTIPQAEGGFRQRINLNGAITPGMEAPEQIESAEESALLVDNKNVQKTRMFDHVSYFSNIQWRLIIWKQAIKETLNSPILGKGFKLIIKPLFTKQDPNNIVGPNLAVTPIHNHIIAVFYKTGIIGLGLFLFLNIYSLFYGLAYLKECKSKFIRCFLIGTLGSLVYWNIVALFFDIIDSPPTSVFLWIIMGLIFACVAADKKNAIDAKNEKV